MTFILPCQGFLVVLRLRNISNFPKPSGCFISPLRSLKVHNVTVKVTLSIERSLSENRSRPISFLDD